MNILGRNLEVNFFNFESNQKKSYESTWWQIMLAAKLTHCFFQKVSLRSLILSHFLDTYCYIFSNFFNFHYSTLLFPPFYSLLAQHTACCYHTLINLNGWRAHNLKDLSIRCKLKRMKLSWCTLLHIYSIESKREVPSFWYHLSW